jgi:hypothetical protein
VKFVQVHRPKLRAPASSQAESDSKSQSHPPWQAPAQRTMVNRRSQSARGNGGYYSSFRLMARPTTTVADRLASRLVSHIKSAPDRGMILRVEYLRELPKRLSDSPCVRDSVALYCAAWASFRRGERSGEFLNMDAYGKALRSLQRALFGPRAVSIETLAAMTLLERTEHMFDRGRPSCNVSHARGIMHLLRLLGPPKPEDEVYGALVYENMNLAVRKES